jgi:hypothetical protein
MKLLLPNNSIRPCLLALASVLLLPVSAAQAAPLTFFANLSGANENPTNTSPGTGLATITLDPTAQTLEVNATFSGLTTPDTAAHIHCCQLMRRRRHHGAYLWSFSGEHNPEFPVGSNLRHIRSNL